MALAAQRHTVVATFHDEERARDAARRLDAAGFDADKVGVVAGNVRQAREAAGSRSPQGALVGAALGAVLGVVLAIMGGGSVGGQVTLATILVAGVVMFAIIGAMIGAITGRAKIFLPRAYGKYERAVELGDALVTVVVDPGERERARVVLRDAGATAIRDEDTTESP